MAGESVVGALRVVLGLDTVSFEDGIKKSSKNISSFAKDVAAVEAASVIVTNFADAFATARTSPFSLSF